MMNIGILKRVISLSLILVFLASSPSVMACANDEDGVLSRVVKFNPNRVPRFVFDANLSTELIERIAYLVVSSKKDWAVVRRQLEDANQSFASGPSLDNARAIVLMRLGQPEQAVDLLLVSEESYPERYDVAANLGTALELSGELSKAKDWIAEGISRNARSHDGTEWLHLRILDARMALSRDGNWLDDNSVTGLDFGEAVAPRFTNGIDKERYIKALKYQLQERISFVSPPDAVVGDLLFDLGNLMSQESPPLSALAHLRLAQVYSPDMNRPLTKRLRHLKEKHRELIEQRAQAAEKEREAWEELSRRSPPPNGAGKRLPAARKTTASEKFTIRHANIDLLYQDLKRLVPTAKYGVSWRRRTIRVRGTGDQLRQVGRLLIILDQPDRY